MNHRSLGTIIKVLFAGVCLGACGCTEQAVSNASENHAASMMELQYQQVVDNLARFVWEENSLPSHVVLTQGIAQISDKADAGVSLPFNHLGSGSVNNSNTGSFNISGERQWTVNWSVKPVVEGDSLVALQGLYRDAIHRSVPPDQRNMGRSKHSTASTGSDAWPSTQGAPWFQVTAPKDESVAYKGTYRNATVYVTSEHMEELSKFTVDVLRNSPNIPPLLPGANTALNP